MFYLNLREMHRNPTYCWDLPAEGLEPTRSCDHWILSPARLPIPPRRRKQSEATKPASVLKCSGRDQAAANFLAARTKNLPERFRIRAREAGDCRRACGGKLQLRSAILP